MEKTDKELSVEIAKRFVEVMHHLMRSGVVKNYTDFAKQMDIRYQSVIDIKQFVIADGKPAYPQVSYLVLLNKIFGVSIDYLIAGEGEMIASYEPDNMEGEIREGMGEYKKPDSNPGDYESRLKELEGQFNILRAQVEHLKNKINP